MSKTAAFLLLCTGMHKVCSKKVRYAVEMINGTNNMTKPGENIIMKYLLEGLFLGPVKIF